MRKHKDAFLGGRFRGSKVSKAWIKKLKFNPKIDIWYVTENGIYFEQLKSAHKGNKARISKKEIASVQRFADKYSNYNFIWVGYVIKEYRKPAREIRLN